LVTNWHTVTGRTLAVGPAASICSMDGPPHQLTFSGLPKYPSDTLAEPPRREERNADGSWRSIYCCSLARSEATTLCTGAVSKPWSHAGIPYGCGTANAVPQKQHRAEKIDKGLSEPRRPFRRTPQRVRGEPFLTSAPLFARELRRDPSTQPTRSQKSLGGCTNPWPTGDLPFPTGARRWT